MKHVFLVFITVMGLFASVIKSPIVSINSDATEVEIQIENIDIGISGFIVHAVDEEHKIILKNAVVKSYDKESKKAKIAISEFDSLSSSALPHGKWGIKVGDMALLAFGYAKGILISPNEDIYYKITKNTKLQWVHPDLFATVLSYNSHPTPLRGDFSELSAKNYIGLVFIYLDGRVFTLDAKSFKILAISDAKLEQKETSLPFYTRVPEIDSSWWKFFDKGNKKLKEYEPHYYKLLVEANKDDKTLYEIIKSCDERLHYLLEEFDFEGKSDDRKKRFGLF